MLSENAWWDSNCWSHVIYGSIQMLVIKSSAVIWSFYSSFSVNTFCSQVRFHLWFNFKSWTKNTAARSSMVFGTAKSNKNPEDRLNSNLSRSESLTGVTGAVKAVVAAMVAVDYLLVGHTQEKKNYCHILSQVKLNKNRLGLERDNIPEPQKKFRLLFFSVDRNRTVSKSGGKCLTEILRNSFLHCKAKKTNIQTSPAAAALKKNSA